MPTETLIAVSAVIAVFAAFAALLVFADRTWDKASKHS